MNRRYEINKAAIIIDSELQRNLVNHNDNIENIIPIKVTQVYIREVEYKDREIKMKGRGR